MTMPPKRIPRTPDAPWAFIRYVIRHCDRRSHAMALLAFFSQGIGIALDVLVSWVLGRVTGAMIDSDAAHLWPNVIREIWLLASLWTVRNAMFRTREFADRRYISVYLNMTRELLFNRLIQQSQAFLHSNFAGVLANHVRRGGEVMGSLLDKMTNNIIPLLVRFITGGVLLWAITPQLTLFLLGFIVFGVICSIPFAPKWKNLSVTQAEKYSQLSGYIVDSATNLATVQQNAGWREEQRRLGIVQEGITRAFVNRLRFVSIFWGSFDFLSTFFFCGFVALLAHAWHAGHVSTGQLAMTVGLMTNLFGALAGTVHLLSANFDDLGTLHETLQKISAPFSVIDAPQAPDLVVPKGEIEFRAVDFAYTPGQPVFGHLSLKIPAGQRVGLVGVSGAGKSSFCQLLLRAYDVGGGGIYIDGQNIATATQDSLHEAIAVIPQEPILFHRSLGDNIRYGRLDATAEEVENAARAAEAAGFIDKLPLRYDTLVGERGIKLSGGQRQRIAIARAIIKNAPILVLDEATSALDSETEKSIQAAILQAMQNRTTLVVAHRLSTLSRMDRIVVMENGKIVEDGAFGDLLAKKGIFARLWELQAGGFLPE